MKARTTLFLAAPLLLAHREGHGQEFPIGAWFPGLFNNQAEHFEERLDQVVEANFNTIHAALGPRNDPAVNRVFLDLAQSRGLNVQLYNWNVPPGWRARSRTFWTKTLEAEDRDVFIHPVGMQDGDAWHANTADHPPGIVLDTPSTRGGEIFLRYVEQQLNSRGRIIQNRARYGLHVFRLKTDDNSTPDRIATLRILRHSDGTELRTRDVRKLEFRSIDAYQDFVIRYSVPPGGARVRYQIDWSGAGNLWVDRIRAHDHHGHRLFSGDYDADIIRDLAAYDGISIEGPWRFYVDDEPQWTEKDESIAYVNDLIKAQTGKSGLAAIHMTRRDFIQHFIDTVSPSELLVNYYPFQLDVPRGGQARYPTGLQGALDSLVTLYGQAREVAAGADIPLWALVQTHSWSNLRNPSPEEIRVQVNLALAHGVTGIYYFMYTSHTNDDGRPDIQGLVDGNYRITSKWKEVQALNRMLGELDDTLLQLTSDAVFPGTAPASFVQRLSDPADYHLGTFTHADGTRYLMVVNRRCQPWPRRPRVLTVELDPSELNGPAWSYLVEDLHTREMAATSNGVSPSFSVSLRPGEGKLFRIEPWDDQITLTGDVKVPAGVKLTLAAGTTVAFAPGDETGGGVDDLRSELIVEGALDAGAGDITFRSSGEAGASTDGSWYGIRVMETGNADLSGATIEDGLRCVEAYETSTLDMTDTAMINCGQAVELLSMSP